MESVLGHLSSLPSIGGLAMGAPRAAEMKTQGYLKTTQTEQSGK